MINEIILVISIGFSPGSAHGVELRVLEYPQVSMEVCLKEMKNINNTWNNPSGRFSRKSICVRKLKTGNK